MGFGPDLTVVVKKLIKLKKDYCRKPEEKKITLGDLAEFGRIILVLEWILNEQVRRANWIHLAQDMTVMNVRVPYNFLIS
jgi:hypothetical protein